ncbi:MAG: hypothetical protein GY754_46620 [bacterium]|nr:hypothetical protein [bacterium]
MKKFLKWIAVILGTLVVLFALILLFFTVKEYTPAQEEVVANLSKVSAQLKEAPDELTVLSWNIGYCGIDKNTDFVLEGGKMSVPKDEKSVRENLDAAKSFLQKEAADVYFIQEVDEASSRSFDINQLKEIPALFPRFSSWFAYNFKVLFIPSPLNDPIGRVNSGILTMTKYNSFGATRYQLPGSFSWPTRVFHLKRCLTLVRIKSAVEGKDWCFLNLHLSAYDPGGTLRKAQLGYVKEMMEKLYAEDNYVVLGGDWNSQFPGVTNGMFGSYTTPEEHLYWVQSIKKDWTPENWTWVYDKSIASCRTLEKPYVKGENFRTIIDGFLISPNVELKNVHAVDLEFVNSDHNPVIATFVLKK